MDDTESRLLRLRDERQDARQQYELTCRRLRAALAETDWTMERMAELLGTSRQSVHTMIRKHREETAE